MSSNSRLDELKQNVLDLSNKKYSVEQQHSELVERKEELLKEKSRNQEAMARMVRSTLVQSELAAAKEREFLKDKIEHFGYKQDRNTEVLIQTKDELTDEIAALKNFFSESPRLQEAYELKNRQLEDEHRIKEQQLEDKYERKKKELENNYELFKTNLEDEHRKLETECERIKAEIETLKKEQVELGDIQKENIKWEKIKSIVPKIAILIVFLVLIVCCFTYCQNKIKDENKALLEQLEHAQTNLYRCDGRGIQTYDENYEEIDGFFEKTTTTYDGYVYLIEQGTEWSLIADVGVRGDKHKVYVKTNEFNSTYTRVEVDLTE